MKILVGIAHEWDTYNLLSATGNKKEMKLLDELCTDIGCGCAIQFPIEDKLKAHGFNRLSDGLYVIETAWAKLTSEAEYPEMLISDIKRIAKYEQFFVAADQKKVGQNFNDKTVPKLETPKL